DGDVAAEAAAQEGQCSAAQGAVVAELQDAACQRGAAAEGVGVIQGDGVGAAANRQGTCPTRLADRGVEEDVVSCLENGTCRESNGAGEAEGVGGSAVPNRDVAGEHDGIGKVKAGAAGVAIQIAADQGQRAGAEI